MKKLPWKSALGMLFCVLSAQAPLRAEEVNVKALFAMNCSWCHGGAGRHADKGPKLMGTQLNDEELYKRIADGSPGKMPGFGKQLKDEEIKAFVAYIKELKPEE